MKHVFYIHSNVVYLVAKGVINYNDLDENKIIFLFDRNMEPRQHDYKSCHFPEFYSYRNPAKEWLYLFRFKRKLKQIVGNQPYHAYVPQTKNKKLQLLIHNNLCERFSILEEGTDSYLEEEKLREIYNPERVKLRDRLVYLNMVQSNEFFQDGYDRVYGLSENSFPGFERKIVLKNVFDFDENKDGVFCDKSILIVDAVSIYNQISLETHIDVIKQVLNYFVEHGIQEVYYKLHPAQIETAEEELFVNIFDNYSSALTMKRLDDDIIIEQLIVKGKELKFFVNISSLGLYAQNYGHEVYSFANFVVERDQNFRRLLKFYTQSYIDEMHFLN